MANYFRIGSLATDAPAQIINLWGYTSGADRYFTYRKLGAGAGYTITAGKTFYIVRVSFWHNFTLADSNHMFAMGYSVNDVGLDSASAPASPTVLFGQNSATYTGSLYHVPTAAAGQSGKSVYQYDCLIPVPAGAGNLIYAGTHGTAANCLIEGLEL